VSWYTSIIQDCLVEYKGISNEWIETLLFTLLPEERSENPLAYKIVSDLLRANQEIIQFSIDRFVPHILQEATYFKPTMEMEKI
jgi:hypothetical protein